MNHSDTRRNAYMLEGTLAKKGYDWWWHSFSGKSTTTGEDRTFFVEYFIINPELGDSAPCFGQISEESIPSYVMVKAGSWGENAKQLHRFYPIRDWKIHSNPLIFKAKDCFLTENHMKGSVEVSLEDAKRSELMSDAGSMSWNLQISKKVAFNVGYGASKFFRNMNAFEMFWHAEGMKTAYAGTVVYEGEEYIVSPETSYGYADKNWGSDFTSPWVWISSCDLVSMKTGRRLQNSVFDVGGGRPKVFGYALNRKLLIDFWYEGKDYEFNFSKFWTETRTKFHCYEKEDKVVWEVETQNKEAALNIRCVCPKKEMLLINYEAPDGKKRHNRLWNGGTGYGEIALYKKEGKKKVVIDKIRFAHAGCEYGIYNN